MEATEDTDAYFTSVAVVRNKYRKSKTFNEENLITNAMNYAPECYHDTLAQELSSKGNKIILNYLKKALKLPLWLKKGGNGNDDDEKGETALSLNDTEVCTRCSKPGHNASNFWAKMSIDDF